MCHKLQDESHLEMRSKRLSLLTPRHEIIGKVGRYFRLIVPRQGKDVHVFPFRARRCGWKAISVLLAVLVRADRGHRTPRTSRIYYITILVGTLLGLPDVSYFC